MSKSKSTFGNCGPVEAVYGDGTVTMRLSKCAKRKKRKGGSGRSGGSRRSRPKLPSQSMNSRSHPSDQPSFPSGEWDMKTRGVAGTYNVRRKSPKGKCHCAVALDKAGFIIGFKCAPVSRPKLKVQMTGSFPEAHKIRIKKCYTPYGVAS